MNIILIVDDGQVLRSSHQKLTVLEQLHCSICTVNTQLIVFIYSAEINFTF